MLILAVTELILLSGSVTFAYMITDSLGFNVFGEAVAFSTSGGILSGGLRSHDYPVTGWPKSSLLLTK